MRRVLIGILLLILVFITATRIQADINEDIANITNEINSLKTSLANKQADQGKLLQQLNGIKLRVVAIEQDIAKKEREVIIGEKALEHQHDILNKRAFSYYKNIHKSSVSLLDFFVGANLSKSLENFFYQQTLVDEDKRTMLGIVRYIIGLEQKKKELQSEKARLVVIKEQVDAETKALGADIASTQQRIAQLSARQQQLVAQKLANLNIPRSAATMIRGCSDDRGVDPGFSPRLAFFTYGAPHRNGLNQYGAFGRAKAGQNEEQILQEYYPNMGLKKDYDQGAQVNVEGHGTFSIEDYVKRIYEVPNSWGDQGGMATLKAQAVAARTYALNTMQRKGSICTTEACQVFRPDPKGGNWDQAVEATRGWVMMDGGNPGFTQYASTHGGYILNLGKFDGSGGTPSSFTELNERAYDKESPWFYCDWGSRSEYSNTAWLKSSEVADIANIIMLAKRDSAVGEHLYQPDKPNPAGTDTWSLDRVKSELRARGGTPLDSVVDASVVVDFGSGKTTSVNIGGVSFDASEFKNWFNLRAPANIQIVGPLYNVEKR